MSTRVNTGWYVASCPARARSVPRRQLFSSQGQSRGCRRARRSGRKLMLSGLIAGALVMLSSLVEGGSEQVQLQHPIAATTASSSPVSTTSKREQLTTTMNLIPVDQPLINGESAEQNARSSTSNAESQNERELLTEPDPIATSAPYTDSLGLSPSSGSAELTASSPDHYSQAINSELGDLSALLTDKQQVELADIYQQQNQQQQQQEQQERLLNKPIKFQQQQQQQLQPERRFGLLKKGHYGSPSMMSVNYGAAGGPAAYLSGNSDCDRCFANLNQQTSADYQQIDPLPIQPVPVPVPVLPAPQPASQIPTQQAFGPLKNKLFMKFPFFMKPMSLPNDHDTPTFAWHHTHHYQPVPRPAPQPSMNSALFLRPAAYNCIQASPPLLGAQITQEVALGAGTKGGQPSGKQYAHQQATYSSSQY